MCRAWFSMTHNGWSFYNSLLVGLNTAKKTRSSIWKIPEVWSGKIMILTLELTNNWMISDLRWDKQLSIKRTTDALEISFVHRCLRLLKLTRYADNCKIF
jgi:hypothetical protein